MFCASELGRDLLVLLCGQLKIYWFIELNLFSLLVSTNFKHFCAFLKLKSSSPHFTRHLSAFYSRRSVHSFELLTVLIFQIMIQVNSKFSRWQPWLLPLWSSLTSICRLDLKLMRMILPIFHQLLFPVCFMLSSNKHQAFGATITMGNKSALDQSANQSKPKKWWAAQRRGAAGSTIRKFNDIIKFCC